MSVARVAIAALLVACSSPPSTTPRPADDSPLRIRVARAEARRGGGIDELIALAKGSKAERVLALRGLGRIGGPKSLDVLIATLALMPPSKDAHHAWRPHSDPHPDVIAAAATAIGLATSLDEDDAGNARITKALLDALARANGAVNDAIGRAADPTAHVALLVAVFEAIGRAADATAQPMLVTGLTHKKPEIAAAAAFALGRYGRRKVALAAESRDALVVALSHADARVRYAAAYALAREQAPTPKDERWQKADQPLAKLVTDSDANVRAIAIAALARRKTILIAKSALYRALHDADWRVVVEAVRALSGEGGDQESRRVVAVVLMFWLHAAEGRTVDAGTVASWVRELELKGRSDNDESNRAVRIETLRHLRDRTRTAWDNAREPSSAHIIIEGLRGLASHTKDSTVAPLVEVLGKFATLSTKLPPLTAAWIECLALVATARGAEKPDYASLNDKARCRLPDHVRLPLVGELVVAKVGTVEQRRTALRPLLAHADARVRVAGITALAALWDVGDAADHRATVATVIAALAAKDGLVAGTAVEAATTIYEADAKKPAGETEWKSALDAAVIARASVEKDPELAGSLFELIGKRTIAAGHGACKAGLAGAPVLVKAAVACLKALGQPVEAPAIGSAAAAPVDITQVIGKHLRWHLATTRGEIVIELSPETAPWAVAMIVTLTRKGFYNGLELHRVVPNFVAQGGDPTQSGWGGPGFTIPAEPSSGAGFVAGGVGIADAGRDSGGSQWFVMHGAAPHLDGRYTWIGRVVSGQKSADALLIGDSVMRATIEVRDRP